MASPTIQGALKDAFGVGHVEGCMSAEELVTMVPCLSVQMATQFHMWDMFKVMDETSANGRQNLAMMLAHLLSSKALPLSVLKVSSIKNLVYL